MIVDWARGKIILAKSLINVILTNLKLVLFAHNWNTGMLECWNIGSLFEFLNKDKDLLKLFMEKSSKLPPDISGIDSNIFDPNAEFLRL